jgi:hypothetical protein
VESAQNRASMTSWSLYSTSAASADATGSDKFAIPSDSAMSLKGTGVELRTPHAVVDNAPLQNRLARRRLLPFKRRT